jgi:hypothetical protein
MTYVPLIFLTILSVQSIACAATGMTERTETDAGPDFAPEELLVTFKDGTDQSRIQAINESLQVQVLRKMLSGRMTLIQLPKDKTMEEMRQAYSSFSEVEAVEPNYKIVPQ